MITLLIVSLFLLGIGNAFSRDGLSPTVEVIVDKRPVPKYYHKGTIYIEAKNKKKYSIRIKNPLGERIAVALSVDGLNTIDAKRTEARRAVKWVIDPYGTIEIKGWQISDKKARQFFFTTEEKSYAAEIGRTGNFGLISAVFFRERYRRAYAPVYEPPPPCPPGYYRTLNGCEGGPLLRDGPGSTIWRGGGMGSFGGGGIGGGNMGAMRIDKSRSQVADQNYSRKDEESEYAATGMGKKMTYEVERIYMDLRDDPFATIDVRYEFSSALYDLGVFPPPETRDKLKRRERATGFGDSEYCPEP
jgi:hypothetical protein